MAEDTKKVYVVNTAFEHEGLSYTAGEKYELDTAFVATLPEGSVTEYVEPPAAPEGSNTTPGAETKPAVEPAKPWVGGHTMKG